MLRLFRSFLNTWAARAFFFVLVASFALWGIGDVIRNNGHDTALATVGDRRIEPQEFQDTFRRELAQVTRMMGGKTEPTPAVRRTVAEQSLDRMIVQAAIAEEVQRLGIVVPDAAVRQAVFAIPAFRGAGGAFDRGVFETMMRNNNLTEGRFLDLMRADLGQRQLVETIQVGVTAPETLLQQIYAYQHETRTGELVDLPFAAAAEPAAPSQDDLQRQYENNPAAYSAPAYRRIKLVVLSPQTVARGIEVTPEESQAYYDAHKAEYASPEKRAAEVVVAGDEAVARKLASAWQAGADWAAMQQAAQSDGASAVAVDLSERTQYPSPDLGDAVFTAAPEIVSDPIKSPFGWQVVRVTKVQPGQTRTFDQVKTEVRDKVAQERAIDLVYDRANKLDDALSSGTSLDDLPGDLGLGAVEGTLDAQGNTPDGEPAPIPGSPALRQAILTAAFSTAPGEKPRMIEGPEQSYYAFHIEDLIDAKLKPLADVETQVRDDWQQAQRRHEQEVSAAKLMAGATAGGSLDDAATIAGLRVEKTGPVPRTGAVEHVPQPVQEALFRLKQGETTMIETPDGFVVVRLAEIVDSDPARDPAAAEQTRRALTASLDQDVEITFATAIRDRAKPTVNRTLLNSLSE